MKHATLRTLVVLLSVGLSVSTRSAESDTAITEVLGAYERAWTLKDSRAVARFYYEPAMRVTAGGPVVRATRAEQESFFTGFFAGLVARGYSRSSWESLEVRLLDANTAIASGATVRYKEDGSELERVALTYALRNTPDGWTIFLSATHEPKSALRFQAARESADSSAPVANVAEIHEAMLSPASDLLFRAETEVPENEKSWRAVRNGALLLAESGNVLTHAAPAVGDARWANYSRALRDAALNARRAAEARNVDALGEANGQIIEVCQGCHVPYRDGGRSMMSR